MITATNCPVQTEKGQHGELIVWLDSPERSVNVIDEAMVAGLEQAIEQAANNTECRAVVFRSRKSDCFIAGADVQVIARLKDAQQVQAIVRRGQQLMQRIVDLKMPTIAAIDGSCLGGGLELALACCYRLASDSPHTKFGCPEIRLGLIPGWGGTQRLPHRVGLRQALTMILKGSSIQSAQAYQYGLINEVVSHDNFEQAIERFVARREMNRGSPPDTTPISRPKRGLWLAWLLDLTPAGRWFVFRQARQKIASQMKHYPALEQAITAVELAYDLSRDGYQFEVEAFSELLFTSTAQSLVGLFVQRDRAKKPETWLKNFDSATAPPTRRLAVIGAGAMGAGIGGLAAIKGIDVVFKEINSAEAQAGADRVHNLWRDQVKHHLLSAENLNKSKDRTKFTADWGDVADCELAIEAVLETHSVKRAVFQMLDQSLPKNSVLATNTSALSVTDLAKVTGRGQQVAGLHFFNPVERMELVEVVRTEMTNDRTLAQLLELVRQLGKTPIVTADQPGFLVNRVLFPYLGEAIRLLIEGGDVRMIDRDLKRFGMPMGPFELMDQVGIDIASHVAGTLAKIQSDLPSGSSEPASLLATMVEKKWLGKKSGTGFYRWDSKNKKHKNKKPNPELLTSVNEKRSSAGRKVRTASLQFESDGLNDVQRRAVYPMLNEAVHCLDQHVVAKPWMVDLGLVLGTGFAPRTGGPLKLIDSIGVAVVCRNMEKLKQMCGNRFLPAEGLTAHAARGEPFCERNDAWLPREL